MLTAPPARSGRCKTGSRGWFGGWSIMSDASDVHTLEETPLRQRALVTIPVVAISVGVPGAVLLNLSLSRLGVVLVLAWLLLVAGLSVGRV